MKNKTSKKIIVEEPNRKYLITKRRRESLLRWYDYLWLFAAAALFTFLLY